MSKKESVEKFNVGDTVRIGWKTKEDDKERTQYFEGVVIAQKGVSTGKTFTVRKIASAQVGVERIFPLQSPQLSSLEVKRRGKVRRAKLYYLRGRTGKAATRVKTRSRG